MIKRKRKRRKKGRGRKRKGKRRKGLVSVRTHILNHSEHLLFLLILIDISMCSMITKRQKYYFIFIFI
jgi:hypothetical protein